MNLATSIGAVLIVIAVGYQESATVEHHSDRDRRRDEERMDE
jgi:hypothetical protein